MAITFDAVSLSSVGTSVSSLTWAHTAAATAQVIVVCIHTRDTGQTVSTVTFNGDACTLAKSQVSADVGDGSFFRQTIFYRLAPDIATGNVVVTFSATVPAMAAASALTLLASGAMSLGATNGATHASTGTPSVDVVSTVENAWIVDAFTHSSDLAFSVGAGQTAREQRLANADTVGASTEPTTTTGTYTMSWPPPAAGPWSIAAAEFTEAAAASTQPPRTLHQFGMRR